MTKEEAIQAMDEGKAVSHHSFTDDEFITTKNGIIFDEAGYELDMFWEYRKEQDFWLTGWRVVKV